MNDNIQRGKRVLTLMRVFLAFSILVIVLAFGIWKTVGSINGGLGAENDASLAMGTVLLTLGFFGSCVVVGIVALVWFICWILWLVNSVSSLRKLKLFSIHPVIALILTLIPFVGQIMVFVIARKQAQGQQQFLESRNSAVKPIPMNFLIGYLVLVIVDMALTFVGNQSPATLITAVAGIGSFVCYMKFFEFLIGQEQQMLQLNQEEILRAKVDQVLREREIEKAASQVQAAVYETERPENPS